MIYVLVILVLACLGCVVAMKGQHVKLSAYRKSDKMKTAFMKGLCSEIRTQLHSVSGLAEIISMDDLYLSKDEKKDISSQIQYNTGLITTLLDEVTVFFSDDKNGGHRLVNDHFSPNLLCQRCIDANRSQVHEGVRLIFKRNLSDSFFASADVHLVELIMNKLISTACKFTMKGEVSVTCQSTSPYLLTFYVEDTGGGIPEGRKRKVFTWFDEPDETVDITEFDLSIAQRLASKLGGFLRMDENLKNGTCIAFTLPVR